MPKGQKPQLQKKKNNEHLQRLRAIQAMKGKLVGKTNKELAAEMGVHTETVERALTYGERAGIFIKLEDELMQKVAPAALKAILSACEDGDAAVALEVINGLLLLQKNNQKVQQMNVKGSTGMGSDLLSYAHKLRLEIEERENTINGSIEGSISEVKQLPAGSENTSSPEIDVSQGNISDAGEGRIEEDPQAAESSSGESSLARLYAEALKSESE